MIAFHEIRSFMPGAYKKIEVAIDILLLINQRPGELTKEAVVMRCQHPTSTATRYIQKMIKTGWIREVANNDTYKKLATTRKGRQVVADWQSEHGKGNSNNKDADPQDSALQISISQLHRVGTKLRFSNCIEVMDIINAGKPMVTEHIAREMCMSHRYVRETVDICRDCGWVTRVSGRRRGYVIALTEEGRELLTKYKREFM